MARLPTVGGDADSWGSLLNEYLQTSHNSDGTLKLDVKTIADLKAIAVAALGDKQQALVAGYYAPGDGGGGQFYYDPAAGDADNGGTVIAPTSGSGRWLRAYSGAVDVRWFGAKGDGATDDSDAFIAAMSAAVAGYHHTVFAGSKAGWALYISKGNYLVQRNNVFGLCPTGTYVRGRIFGDSWSASRILFRPNGGDDLASDDKYYLYDGGTRGVSNSFVLFNVSFADIGVYLDTAQLEAGQECGMIRMFGNTSGQNLEMHAVSVIGSGTKASGARTTVVLDVTGDVNGSDNHFSQCEFRYCTHLVRNENPQGMNFDFFGCNVWGIASNFFQIEPGGGLEMRSWGGSWIWSENPDDGQQYLIYVRSTPPSKSGASHVSHSALSPAEKGIPKASEVAAYCAANAIANTSVYYTGTDSSADDALVVFTIGAAGAVTASDWGSPFRGAYGIARGNFTAQFYSSRAELKAAGSRLVYAPAKQDIIQALFSGVNFVATEVAGSRSVTVLGAKKTITFSDCALPKEIFFRFTADNADLGSNKWSVASNGTVLLRNSNVGADLSANAKVDFSRGRVVAEGCRGNYGLASLPAYVIAADFDTNPHETGYLEAGPRVKSVVAKPPQRLWTSSAVYGCVLPYGARVVGIEVHKPGSGSATPALTITVSDGDGTVLAASPATAANIDIVMLETIAGANRVLKRTTENSRTITVAVSGGAFTSVSGGFARIDYL